MQQLEQLVEMLLVDDDDGDDAVVEMGEDDDVDEVYHLHRHQSLSLTRSRYHFQSQWFHFPRLHHQNGFFYVHLELEMV